MTKSTTGGDSKLTPVTTHGDDAGLKTARDYDARLVGLQKTAPGQATTKSNNQSPLLAQWRGPFGGVPAFDKVKVEDFQPAVKTGIAENRKELERIANNPEAPTFANTIEAYEDAGRSLGRALTYYSVWSSTLSTPELQAIEEDLGKDLSAFDAEKIQNEKLFQRIESVYQSPELAKLTPEQRRLTSEIYNGFVREGAKLDPVAKKELAKLDERLSVLFNRFRQNMVNEAKRPAIVIASEKDLAGLPASLRANMASAASAAGLEGKWSLPVSRSFVDAFLTYSTRRDLREKVLTATTSRNDRDDALDNNAIGEEILKVRAKRAKLLGKPTHAHLVLEDSMTKTPERALELLEKVWTPAVARVREEVADMQAIADKEGKGVKIQPWDYLFYAEKVRKARFDFDSSELKPYLQLDNIRDAMFWTAEQLFGFKFKQVSGLPVSHPDVTVYSVKDRNGSELGLLYMDPYAREGKSSGAWMSTYRDQEKFRGNVSPIVSNNCNFAKPSEGEPTLLSWEDAVTAFHEFGHALHGLSSNVSYPSLAGSSVVRDFVELPSQLFEQWLATPEVLSRFARHVDTGEPMPKALIEKIHTASTFNEGYSTVGFLKSAMLDLKLHLAGDQDINLHDFERELFKELGAPEEVKPFHRPQHFKHIFGSNGYSAQYSSYLAADVLKADGFEAFQDAGGPFDPTVARRFFDNILSVGNSRDPGESYRAFRGREPEVDALLRSRGFPVAAS